MGIPRVADHAQLALQGLDIPILDYVGLESNEAVEELNKKGLETLSQTSKPFLGIVNGSMITTLKN